MSRLTPLILLLTLLFSGCGYIYAKDEVAQMTSELARLSGQNTALVEELTRMETEMTSLREAVGLAGGAVLAPSAVTDPLQQIVLKDLSRQTALIPVNEEGTGLLYAVSTAVFFGDNNLYVYAQGERMGVDLILSYAVKADGFNTVEWKALFYDLGEGWVPVTQGQPVKSVSPDSLTSSGAPFVVPDTAASSSQASSAVSVPSVPSVPAPSVSSVPSVPSVPSETPSSVPPAGISSDGTLVPETTPLPPADTNPAQGGMRDAYLDILNRVK